jgi:hypothetical protein
MSWLAVRMERARKQKEAVEAIEEAGGYVHYDYECDYYEQFDSASDFLQAKRPKSPWPIWLRPILGDDFLHSVVEVALVPRLLYGFSSLSSYDPPIGGPLVTEGDLDLLQRFPRLRRLSIDHKLLTDSAAQKLAMFSELRYLSLEATGITDDGLEHIGGMTNLRELWLYETEVTPEGVKKLQEALPDCEIVY